MSTLTIRRTWKVEGVLTDVTSATISVVRDDTGASVVSTVAMTKISTGTYEHSFTEPVAGLDYTATVIVVYDGDTYTFEVNATGTSSTIASIADVMLELGLSSPTTNETNVVTAAVKRAEAALKRFLGFDPLLHECTEYHPQQNYQAQISRGIWEVMEQRAMMRQISEAATNELQVMVTPVRESPTPQCWKDYDGRSGTQTGSFGTATALTIGSQFWPNYDGIDASGSKICRDGIIRTIGLWPTSVGSVKLVYWGGYSSDELRGDISFPDPSPVPIWEVAVQEAARRARKTLLLAKSAKVGWVGGWLASESLGDYSYSVDGGYGKSLMAGDLTAESKERLSSFTNWGAMLGM